jgi:hypothetical protein
MSEIADPSAAAAATPVPGRTDAAPSAADPLAEVPALSPERLPPNYRKHVDPASPPPLRGMAAKGLVPLSPSDMCHCLAMLCRDADPGIAASAKKTASGLPDKIMSAGLRDEGQSPRTLHAFAEALEGKDAALEYIVLNNTTHDFTVAEIARTTTSAKLLEIVANNQLRILRDERILRAVIGNPSTSKAIVDLTCDFAVRSGLVLADLPAMIEAHVRVHGAPPRPPDSAEAEAAKADTAEAVMQEYGDALTNPGAPPMEEGKRLNLTQRIARMSIADKIKLATLGNREARGILMRDPNKLVALAVIHSPRITDGEVLSLAHSKTCQDDVLRVITSSRDWTRQYPIRLALVKNPKVPLAVAMRFLSTMRDSEIKDLSGNKNIPSAIRVQAKKMLEKKAAH